MSTLLSFLLLLLVTAQRANSLAFQARRLAPRTGNVGVTFAARGNSSAPTLGVTQDRYATNITVDGQNLLVAIDTGSTDLWIVPRHDYDFDSSGMPASISYAAAAVNGTIDFAQVQLGPYNVSKQAFLCSTREQVELESILDEGLDGLIGFAFNGASASRITQGLQDGGYKDSNNAGQPFIFNLFDSTPDVDNFIAISLSRTDDLEGSAEASFTINELDKTYSAVSNSPHININPPDGGRWTIPLDGITVDGKPVALPPSEVAKTPRGKMTVLLDTGTPSAGIPLALFNAIYGNIPGALWSASQNQSVIPCNTTAIVTVIFGGVSFPIHPLDLSVLSAVDGVTVCTSSFTIMESNHDFDALFGDAIMRNFYSVFNFGSAIAKSPSAASSIQLLSQTDANASIADVTKVRMALLAKSPREGVPSAYAPLTSINPPAVDSVSLAAGSGSGSDDDDSELQKYAPIAIGLLSANMLILLVLVVIGVIVWVKGGRTSGQAAVNYRPVPFREAAPRASESYEDDKRYSD
ncbi:aspartic peptidase domain-containing protein [Mycena filopes]|nr:aspartic peptidase domain-containing protein [Mycena filopes]